MHIAYFYDSWGRAYVPCDPSTPGAKAFGPTVSSVPAPHLPSWAEAEERGLLVRGVDEFSWDYVPLRLALDEFETSSAQREQSAALLGAVYDGTVKVARRRKASGAAMQRDTAYQGMSSAELNKLDALNTPLKRRRPAQS